MSISEYVSGWEGALIIMKQTMAVVAFTFAMVFAIAGIIIPPLGVIDGSVLILIAQLLVFCATFFGIDNYVNLIRRK